MKKFCLFSFVVFPLALSAQPIITASTEPIGLYEQINNSMASDNPKKAIKEFKSVIDFYESHGRANELPQSYFGMALVLALNGNYKESIRYHKKAIKIHKKYRKDSPTEIYINLGLTYELAGKNRRAKRLLAGKNLNS